MGTYAESLLTPDERVIMRQRQHPIALVLDSWPAIILWGITLILLIARFVIPEEILGWKLFGDETWFGTAGNAVMLVTLLLGIAVVAWRWWWWRTQEFLVTNRRLVLAWGVFSKSASDSSLEKINDAQLRISFFGRFLDYGHLEVLTAAPIQGADLLDRLHHAKAFKKAMMTAKHDLQRDVGDGEDYPRSAARSRGTEREAEPERPATATAAGKKAGIDVSGGDDPLRADTPDEVTAVLGELARLRDAGTITGDEYEAKKAELLARL